MKTALFANLMNLAITAYENDMLGYVRPDYAEMLDTFEGHTLPIHRRLRC